MFSSHELLSQIEDDAKTLSGRLTAYFIAVIAVITLVFCAVILLRGPADDRWVPTPILFGIVGGAYGMGAIENFFLRVGCLLLLVSEVAEVALAINLSSLLFLHYANITGTFLSGILVLGLLHYANEVRRTRERLRRFSE